MDIKQGEKGEQRNMRQFLKEQLIPTKDNSTPDFLFKQMKSATYNRVYLAHRKVHNNGVNKFKGPYMQS